MGKHDQNTPFSDDDDDDFMEPLAVSAKRRKARAHAARSVLASERAPCCGQAHVSAPSSTGRQDRTATSAPTQRRAVTDSTRAATTEDAAKALPRPPAPPRAAAGAAAAAASPPPRAVAPSAPPPPAAPPRHPAPAGPRVAAVVAALSASRREVVHTGWLPRREACFDAPPGFALPPELAAVLGRAGLLPLYSHQAVALGEALAGRSVVVSTPSASLALGVHASASAAVDALGHPSSVVAPPSSDAFPPHSFPPPPPPAASGKSVCFLAPVLASLSESDKPSKQGRALVLFPLKALAHDQARPPGAGGGRGGGKTGCGGSLHSVGGTRSRRG